jgi:predicted nuclease of predicted toxin-antitoxin system
MLNCLPDWLGGWPTRDTYPSTSIIVTKDEDFAERTARTDVGPVIVWLRIGNATNRALLEWLEPRWSSVVQLLIDDNRLIEVR